MKKDVLKKALQEAFSYEQFIQIMEENAGGGDERALLNLQRSRRIHKTGQIPESLVEKVKQLVHPQIWLVITEDWCGDSAQTLPFLARLAGLNGRIRLRIVARDENPELMALYLTDGKQAIPKWIILDEELNELAVWGGAAETGSAAGCGRAGSRKAQTGGHQSPARLVRQG